MGVRHQQSGCTKGAATVNTRFLEEFLVIAEELNYSTAAERLFTTRPTLVEHLRSLEAELACKLVITQQRRIALTPAGSRFVQTARSVLASWEEVRAEYASLADNLLVVRVAASSLPWLETILHRARLAIHKAHPYKHIEIATDNGPLATVDALAERANDIAVVGYKRYCCTGDNSPLPPGLCGFHLRTEEIKLLATPESPLFDRAHIVAADLDGATLMLPPDIYASWQRDNMADQLARRGARVQLQTQGFSDHVEYFSYDFGPRLGIVPTTLIPRMGIDAREEYRAFSLDDMPIETSFFAVFKESFVATENGALLFEEMQRASSCTEAGGSVQR